MWSHIISIARNMFFFNKEEKMQLLKRRGPTAKPCGPSVELNLELVLSKENYLNNVLRTRIQIKENII